MNELIELYVKHNLHRCDKWGTPKQLAEAHNRHQYLLTYDPLFKRLKSSDNVYRRILEIGIATGDSLNLWAAYFTQSVIFGIDNQTSKKRRLHARVREIIGKAYCPEMITRLKDIGKFDLIIEDGSHIEKDIKFVIDNYCDLLTDDGILVIEDVNNGTCPKAKKKYADIVVDWFPEDLRKSVYIVYDDRENSGLFIDTLVIYDKHEKSRGSM